MLRLMEKTDWTRRKAEMRLRKPTAGMNDQIWSGSEMAGNALMAAAPRG
jgi:hypothetical protein